jgi:eukaryotic-like serine/threonine-protein kinase
MLENVCMTQEHDVFHEALEQPAIEARPIFFDRATVGDPKLREAVEARLENNQADTLLEQDPAEHLRGSMEAKGQLTLKEEQIDDAVGRHRLLEKIGEGGFGVVDRAEQCEPARRHVAVKVIKLGMDTKSMVARFEAERQALALMEHVHRNAQLCALRRPLARRQPSSRLTYRVCSGWSAQKIKGPGYECLR